MKFSARKRMVAAGTTASLVAALIAAAGPAHAGAQYTLGVDAASSANVGANVSLKSSFEAPKNGKYVVDTEIYNASGKQVIQFDEDLTMKKGAEVTRTYSWKTSGLAAGTYTIKQGLFTADWDDELQWDDSAAKVKLNGSGSSTPTTAKPSSPTTAKPSSPTTKPPSAPSSGKSDLASPDKKDVAMQLVSSAENSSLNWKAQYSYIEDIGDGRGYTAGIIGFCSGCGDMQELVHYYNGIQPNNPLKSFTSALDKKGSWDASHDGLGDAFVKAWKEAAKDSKFQQAQDHERDRVYFNPAVDQAKEDGLRALGQFVYYDAMVVHGPGSDKMSFGGIRSAAMKKAKTPAQGGDETAYLNAFMDARNTVMKAEEAHSDVSRIETAQRVFLKNGNLDLNTPLSWKVYGDSYSIKG